MNKPYIYFFLLKLFAWFQHTNLYFCTLLWNLKTKFCLFQLESFDCRSEIHGLEILSKVVTLQFVICEFPFYEPMISTNNKKKCTFTHDICIIKISSLTLINCIPKTYELYLKCTMILTTGNYMYDAHQS
jgi:hypothetical protein